MSRRTRPPRARASGAASARLDPARAAALRPRPPRAPDRTCRPADLRRPRAPAATRADTRPRHMRGRLDCRVEVSEATGRPSVAESSRRASDDEPASFEEHLSRTELGGQLGTREVALEYVPTGPVRKHSLLPLHGRDAVVQGRVDDDQL